VRQEGVLLRLVEAMHLVHEHDGRAAILVAREARPLHRVADLLHAGEDRRDGDELGVEGARHQAREGGLPDPRRAPEDHRMRPTGTQRHADRLALAQQVLLADHLVDGLRSQALGERHVHLAAGSEEVA
jgi:hypothetical protein